MDRMNGRLLRVPSGPGVSHVRRWHFSTDAGTGLTSRSPAERWMAVVSVPVNPISRWSKPILLSGGHSAASRPTTGRHTIFKWARI